MICFGRWGECRCRAVGRVERAACRRYAIMVSPGLVTSKMLPTRGSNTPYLKRIYDTLSLLLKSLPHTASTSGTNCVGLTTIVPLRGTARSARPPSLPLVIPSPRRHRFPSASLRSLPPLPLARHRDFGFRWRFWDDFGDFRWQFWISVAILGSFCYFSVAILGGFGEFSVAILGKLLIFAV